LVAAAILEALLNLEAELLRVSGPILEVDDLDGLEAQREPTPGGRLEVRDKLASNADDGASSDLDRSRLVLGVKEGRSKMNGLAGLLGNKRGIHLVGKLVLVRLLIEEERRIVVEVLHLGNLPVPGLSALLPGLLQGLL